MKKIAVERSMHIEYEYPSPDAEKTPATMNFRGTYVAVRDDSYVSTRKPVLVQCICRDWLQYFQRSEDNGKTWQYDGDWTPDDAWAMPDTWGPNYAGLATPPDKVMVRYEPYCFLDPDEYLLCRIYPEGLHCPKGSIWGGSSPLKVTLKNYCQVSSDEGVTWSEPEQIIQKGNEFNEDHWARDIYCGKHSGHVRARSAVRLSNGEILVPLTRIFYEGKRMGLAVACFLAQWRKDKSGLTWELGEDIAIDPILSSSGVSEPSIVELSDGRLFMIMRANKSNITNIPSFKYYAVSEDNARTWSPVKVLTQPDGSVIYSPSCLADTFCSLKNGRLYIITTLLDRAPQGHDPRYPLQIAEVDQETFCVIPETVTIIENRKPQMGEPEDVRFSNFRWHEDRETKDIVLYMTACPGNRPRTPDCGCPMHSYRYDIHLPE